LIIAIVTYPFMSNGRRQSRRDVSKEGLANILHAVFALFLVQLFTINPKQK